MKKTWMETAKKVRAIADEAILDYIERTKKGKAGPDAVNIADLKVVDVTVCQSVLVPDNNPYLQIEIEEASPSASKFQEFVVHRVLNRLVEEGVKNPFQFIEVETEW